MLYVYHYTGRAHDNNRDGEVSGDCFFPTPTLTDEAQSGLKMDLFFTLVDRFDFNPATLQIDLNIFGPTGLIH